MSSRGKRPLERPGRSLALAILAIRRRIGITQTELGRRMGWPRNIISQYEKGRVRPSAERLIALLRLAEDGERAAILSELEIYGLVSADLSSALTGLTGKGAEVCTSPVCAPPDGLAMTGAEQFTDKGIS